MSALFQILGDLLLKSEDIVNRLVSYMAPVAAVASLDGRRFLLPARCRFLLSDISNITPLLFGMLLVSCHISCS